MDCINCVDNLPSDCFGCVKQLRAENAQLKGEEPIPEAWWKDCPKMAQKVMERIIAENEKLDNALMRIKKRACFCDSRLDVECDCAWRIACSVVDPETYSHLQKQREQALKEQADES